MIKVKNVSYAYKKGNNVLDDVSFTANAGEITILLGKNGQGKSTILKLINRIYKLKDANIEINDRNINEYKSNELAKVISYVGQESIQAPITVFEEVMLGRIPHYNNFASEKDLAIVATVIEELNLSSLSDRFVTTLSGGERQMVSIARALAQEAKVILLDEPMNNLDIENQLALAKIIKRIAKEKGISFIITMHDINFSLLLGDKFVMMKNHKIAHEGYKEVFTENAIKDVYGISCEIVEYHNEKYILLGEKNEKNF